MNERITEDNFVIFCAKVYDNPCLSSTDEFVEDLARIKYIKKLITRFNETGELRERLILNHVIILHNCFGIHLSRIMFLKFEKHFHQIKPFLVFINALPPVLRNVGNHDTINTDDYSLDEKVVTALRNMKRNG